MMGSFRMPAKSSRAMARSPASLEKNRSGSRRRGCMGLSLWGAGDIPGGTVIGNNQMHHQQRRKISECREEEDRGIAAQFLQHIAGIGAHQHAAQGARQAAQADYRAGGPAREKIGGQGIKIGG